jgi:tryptophan halogenase
MVAAAISRTIGKVLDIKLIESDEIGTVGVGEATIPPLVHFHRLLNIPEQDFMAATQATFKLGIQFENWKDRGENYIHSFGSTGQDHWTAGFQHFWLKAASQAGGDSATGSSSSGLAREQSPPQWGMNYAYHPIAGQPANSRAFAGLWRAAAGRKLVEVPMDPAPATSGREN